MTTQKEAAYSPIRNKLTVDTNLSTVFVVNLPALAWPEAISGVPNIYFINYVSFFNRFFIFQICQSVAQICLMAFFGDRRFVTAPENIFLS